MTISEARAAFVTNAPRCDTATVVSGPTTVASGTSNGVSRRRAFDRWLRYPAGFSESTLHEAFTCLEGTDPRGAVVDPFCGVATVGTAARSQGRGFIGLEAHPWIATAAQLKFEVPADPAGLVAAASEIVADVGPGDVSDEPELLRRVFSDEVLAILVTLRERIRSSTSVWTRHLELALMSNLRAHAGVKVGWPYQLPSQPRQARSADPCRFLQRRANMMADDLALWAQNAPPSVVVHGDSRDAQTWTSADFSAAVGAVSSPPYLNNFDYADATRLEMYFSGAVSSWRELCLDVRDGMVVATTQQSSVGQAATALDALRRWPGVRAHVERLAGELERERLRRPRGKEYSRVVAPYFAGVGRVLEYLASALPAGAPVVLVVGDSAPYGIYVDTPSILLALGSEVGLEPVANRPLRSRGTKWRTNGSRHQVALSEQLVELRVSG